MSAAREFALEIAERITGLGTVSVRRFFSGAGLVADDVQFAFVIDGTLYLKVDDEHRPAFEAMGARPFVYEGKRKSVTISSYYETPEDVIYDDDELRKWAVRSYRVAAAARAARAPKKKSSQKKSIKKKSIKNKSSKKTVRRERPSRER